MHRLSAELMGGICALVHFFRFRGRVFVAAESTQERNLHIGTALFRFRERLIWTAGPEDDVCNLGWRFEV